MIYTEQFTRFPACLAWLLRLQSQLVLCSGQQQQAGLGPVKARLQQEPGHVQAAQQELAMEMAG